MTIYLLTKADYEYARRSRHEEDRFLDHFVMRSTNRLYPQNSILLAP